MRARIGAGTALALALALPAGMAGCGGDGPSSAPRSTTTTGATTASTTTVPSTTASTTTAPPGPALAFPAPREAIDHLVDAWRAGDRAAALAGAELPAVDALFAQPSDGYDLYGCDSGEFSTSTCNFRNRSTGGYAQVTAKQGPGGWVVISVFVSTDG